MTKLLVLVGLAAAAATHGIAAVSYCPSGTLGTANVAFDTAGEVYSANGCTIQDGSILTLNATIVPSGVNGKAITAVFTKGKAGAGSGLEFAGPSAEAAATMNPFKVTISDSDFQADAAIRLHGSLPPNSEVIVSGNTVTVSKAIFSDIRDLLFASPIYMYGFQDPFRLYPNSGYSILRNKLKCHSPSGSSACYGLGLWATLYMREGSWLDVSYNEVLAVGTEQWWADGIDGMQDLYVEGENTRITIDYNNVTLDMGSGIEPPIVYTDKNHNNGQGDFSTYVSISHNRFVGKPNPLYPEAVYLERFVLTGSSEYNVAYNYIEVEGTDARMSLNGLVTLNDNARFNIQHNTIIANGGTPQINTRSGGWILNDKSQLWVTGNWLDRNDNAFPNRPYFQFDNRFMLIDESRAYIMNNTLTARNMTRPYYVAASTTNTYVYKADYARLKVCYNTYFGNLIDTDEELNATLTYNWFHVTDPVEYCWDKVPEAFQTQKPMSKPPSAASSLSIVVAVCALLVAVGSFVFVSL